MDDKPAVSVELLRAHNPTVSALCISTRSHLFLQGCDAFTGTSNYATSGAPAREDQEATASAP